MNYWSCTALFFLLFITTIQQITPQPNDQLLPKKNKKTTLSAEIFHITAVACYLGLLYGGLTNKSILRTGTYDSDDVQDIVQTGAITASVITLPAIFTELMHGKQIRYKNIRNKMHATFYIMLLSKILGGTSPNNHKSSYILGTISSLIINAFF